MTAAPIRILVTGFGGFPGSAKNPTTRLIHALEKHRARLARLGIDLALHVLPVVYAQIAPRLKNLAQIIKPDAILHFGLATRRTTVCVETRALNRVSLLRPDATGARALRRVIIPGAGPVVRSTFPSRPIIVALQRAGLQAKASINAGDYVCNQTLFTSLSENYARSIGFIHVPRLAQPRRSKGASRRQRPTLEEVTRAAVIAIIVSLPALRFGLAPKCGDEMKQARPKCLALDPEQIPA